jgi:hypothetical protein
MKLNGNVRSLAAALTVLGACAYLLGRPAPCCLLTYDKCTGTCGTGATGVTSCEQGNDTVTYPNYHGGTSHPADCATWISQSSSDWWIASCGGQSGFYEIPECFQAPNGLCCYVKNTVTPTHKARVPGVTVYDCNGTPC